MFSSPKAIVFFQFHQETEKQIQSIQLILSKNKMNHKYLSLAIFSTLLIICMSSIPDNTLWGNGSLSEQIISNLAHIPAYALLTFLWLKSFVGTESKNNIIVFSLILSGLVLFAVSDEIHQSFVPGRTASFMDIGLDLLGILFGFWVFRIFRMFTKEKKFGHPF